MRMYDVIAHKKFGKALTDEEIRYFVNGFTSGEIPDYQASALLMAICINGMDEHETAVLTDAMARSGDMVDLSSIPGVKVDKHSTGGVGDKTSLIIGPIVASYGVPVAKMSGRGLGHSGGTIDKLESIPGLRTAIEPEEFYSIVRETGLAIIGQSGNITPADKKIYALRDVTATVDSIPLIASSIMSKKLAAGSDAILLDVKAGGGAFMKTPDDSIALAKTMVSIGNRSGRRTMALITNMDVPLGNAIGNALEVSEVVSTLRGRGPGDLTEVCVELAAYMLMLAAQGRGSSELCPAETCTAQAQAAVYENAKWDGSPMLCTEFNGEHSGAAPLCSPAYKALAEEAIKNGKAYDKFCRMVQAQGGDVSVLMDGFPKAAVISPIKAEKNGYITHMDAEAFGIASLALGAGRVHYDDAIDYSAGIVLEKKPGDYISAGDTVAYLHTSAADKLQEAESILTAAYTIGEEPPPPAKTILTIIDS